MLPKAKTLLRVLRPSIFVFFNIQGPVGDDDRKTSMRLIADELVPQLRAYAKETDLVDPFERTPGSVTYRNGVARDPVVDRTPLKELGIAAAPAGEDGLAVGCDVEPRRRGVPL